MRDILMWVLTIEVLGLACLPLLRAFFENRRDAALLSRPVGLALVAYLGWLFSHSKAIGFERGTLLLALVLIGLASFLTRRAARRAGKPAEPFWGAEEKWAALLFWIPTAIFLVIRASVPAVEGQEKFMDLAFFNSLTRFGSMPPADPWMAGQTINYYYWGYLLAAVLAKLAAVPTFVSYNLSIATFAGYSFVTAACVGMRLSGGRRAAAVWAGIGTVFAGNLTGAFDAWRAPFSREFDYWHASRVIGAGKTINEFPFFTFFHADLHPHLLAYPFFVAAFAVAHRYIEIPPRPAGSSKPADLLERFWPPFLLALLAGTARAGNNWNLPAMAILLVFAAVMKATGGRRIPPLGDLIWGAIVGAGILLLSLILFLPYSRSYALQTQGLGRTTMKSDLMEFLGVWGILLAAGYAGLLFAARAGEKDLQSRRRGDLILTIFAAVSLFAAFAAKAPALIAILPAGLLAAWLALSASRSPEGDPQTNFTSFLVVLAVGIIAGCEFIYFKDSYGLELQRMNTIFKFYHQAWPVLAIAVAVLAERVWRKAARRFGAARVTLAAAMALCLFYPVEAAASRIRQREGQFSLDLRKALARRASGDAVAIDWMTSHAPGGSVVMEATGNPYSDFARISSHTGVPTVLGWANHEGLWRSNDAEIAQRAAVVRSFYSTADPRAAAAIVQRYRITHVVVGDLERQAYPSANNVAKFPFLRPVSTGDTTIYKVTAAP